MANEKIKGIKCLLKSADVKAVIGFATNARQTEVFVLAGNFLQNQNWHNDPEIMKTIIYTINDSVNCYYSIKQKNLCVIEF